MKILFLHLSDMHFDCSENYDENKIKAITSTIQPYSNEIGDCFIIISGDLSFSGKKNQFISIRKFISALRRSISQKYTNLTDVNVLIVPGNHDVDYDKGEWKSDDLAQIEEKNTYESLVLKELEKQENYIATAKMFNCFEDNKLVCVRKFSYEGHSIRFNLINTACFSSRVEDQGFHFITNGDIESLGVTDDCDIVITVMHHPHHWFTERIRKQVENSLYEESDLIYLGHEHYENSMSIENRKAKTHLLSGGKLSNQGNWVDSEIHLSIIDLDTRELRTHKYRLDSSQCVYTEKDSEVLVLQKNRKNSLGISLNRDYIMKLSGTVSDYDIFVFPLLTENGKYEGEGRLPKELNSIDELLNYIIVHKHIIIEGKSDSGKSLLALHVFEALSSRKLTLLINGNDLSGNFESTIRDAFEKEYSQDFAQYQKLKQSSPDDLAIVIDDFDCIDERKVVLFRTYVEQHFNTIIEFRKDEIDIEIEKRLKKRQDSEEIQVFHIEPFFSDRREALIRKVVDSSITDSLQDKEKTISFLCDYLYRQRNVYNKNPRFIVQLTKYYCNNIGEPIYNNGSIFSKVFESNIVSMIKHQSGKLSVDKIFILLDKIAYGIFINQEYPISLISITKIINAYNEEYDSKVDTVDLLHLLEESNIFKKTDIDKYCFSERNYLSYFIAREIKRICIEEDDYSVFMEIMNHAYSGFYADILLFITYMVDNLKIIRMLIDYAKSSVDEWSEYYIGDQEISFMRGSFSEAIRPYSEEDKKKEAERREQQERRENQSIVSQNDSSIFTLNKKELTLLDKISRSISMMVIMSRTLPAFEHLMKKDEKEQCVDLIYKMPLKIFKCWAKIVNEMSASLIDDIKKYYEIEYGNQKQNFKPLTDDKALKILRWDASSLLLDLMNASIINATKDNTWIYLDKNQYKANNLNSIEHLMGVGCLDRVEAFIKDAENTFTSNDDFLVKEMTQRVAKHYMVTSKNIKRESIQRLNKKLFNNSLKTARITMEQRRNASR